MSWQVQLYLLAYTCEDAVRLIYLEALGPHENFYRDLKR
jgi:mRNA interferase RelE/StbE